MKVKSLFVISITIIGILFSCSKDKTLLKTYELNFLKTGDVMLFSNSGEITNQKVIDEFVVSNDIYNIFGNKEPSMLGERIEVEILSDSKAKITARDSSIYYSLQRENGILRLQSLDTLTSYVYSLEDIQYNKLKYPPMLVVDTSYIFSSPRSMYRIKYIPYKYFIESSGEITMPIVGYIEKKYSKFGTFLMNSQWGLNNSFNVNYLNKIQSYTNTNDTIAVQQNSIVFSEKIN